MKQNGDIKTERHNPELQRTAPWLGYHIPISISSQSISADNSHSYYLGVEQFKTENRSLPRFMIKEILAVLSSV